jgi:DNA polymerase-1
MKALIIDCNYICHASANSIPKQLSFQQVGTGVVYGFIKRISWLAELFPSDVIAFVWDSKLSIRGEVYPAYKSNRSQSDLTPEEKRQRDDAYKQFDVIRKEVLPNLGFSNNFIQDGYEGDDLMASIVFNNPGWDFVLVTTDQDMYQLISPCCVMFNPAKKIIKDVKAFKDEFGCDPSYWAEAKAIAGCSTDNVIGIRGIGEKTATKYLSGNLSNKSKAYEKIKRNGHIIAENRELVKLPLFGTDPIVLNGKDSTTKMKYISVCEEYGFKSLLSTNMINKWEKAVLKDDKRSE